MFDEIVMKRRSTREFKSDEVPKEDILKMLEMARWAPSAANRQPWHFIVLTKEKKNAVADIMHEEFINMKNVKSKEVYATREYSPTDSVSGSIGVIKEAPVLIAVLRPKKSEWLEGDYLSIGGAVEHICLKATDLGVDSLIIRDIVYTRERIADYLGYPDMELVVSIALGYSKEFPYPRKKKDLSKMVEWM